MSNNGYFKTGQWHKLKLYNLRFFQIICKNAEIQFAVANQRFQSKK